MNEPIMHPTQAQSIVAIPEAVALRAYVDVV